MFQLFSESINRVRELIASVRTSIQLIIENLMGIQRKKGVFQKSKKPILINELKEIINIISRKG